MLTVLISHDIGDEHGVLAGMSLLSPSQSSPYDVHPDMEEVFYVISGGNIMYVPNGAYHQFIADGYSSLHLFWASAAEPVEEFEQKFKKWKPVEWPEQESSDAQ